MRLFTACFVGVMFLAVAEATPITLTFSGTASGTVDGTTFSNESFSITFDSDTTELFTIPDSDPDTGDITTTDPTANSFVIGPVNTPLFSGSLTGMPTNGPAVFLNAANNNVGVWFYEESDWLVTASSAYTSAFGLANNLTVTNLSTSANDAFGNDTMPGTGAASMDSTAGAIDLSALSNVTFTEAVAATSGTSGASGASGPSGPSLGTGSAGAVPEPSTLLMFGLGIAGVALGKIRRRRR